MTQQGTSSAGHAHDASIRAARLDLLRGISSIAISSLDAERIAHEVADAVDAHFSPLFVVVRLANRERNRLRIASLRGLPDAYVAEAGILSADQDHIVAHAFSSGEPQYGEDIAAHPLGPPLARDLASCGMHPRSYIVLPLKGRATTVGVLTFGWADSRPLSAADIDLFSSLANIFAAGVENAYFYEDERGAAEVARRLSVASEKLATEFSGIFESLTDAVVVVNATGAIQRANSAATRLFGFDPVDHDRHSFLETADVCNRDGNAPRTRDVPYEAALAGETVCDVPLVVRCGDTETQVLVSASPIATDGVVTAAVSVWRDITERERLIDTLAHERKRVEDILASITDGFAVLDSYGRYRSVNASFASMFGMSAEEMTGRRMLDVFPGARKSIMEGALASAIEDDIPSSFVQCYEPTGVWAETRVYPAPEGATMFVSDITTRRQADEERERLLAAYEVELARTSLLKDIAATAGSSLSVEQVCRLVIDTVRSHLTPAQGMLHLFEESADSLVLASYFGLSAATASAVNRVDVSHPTPFGRVISRSIPLVTHDTPDAMWPDEERAAAVRWIVVPIASAERPLGTLGLAFDERRPFTEDEVSLLRGITRQLAVALDNARLYQHEQRIADTLQRSLLAESTRVHGLEVGRVYRSATEHVRVGGDFYDLYPLPDGRAVVTIGDVSGKGLRAASVTALVRNTLRAYALERLEPHAAMYRANNVLCYFSESEVFATAAYAVLDPVGGALTYCNGGHPPPLVLHANGTVTALDELGPMLGAMEEMAYRPGTATLGQDDALLLYTDGVTEARNESGFFGEERLAELLRSMGGAPAEAIARAVADTATAFGGGVLRDDIAVVALKLGRGRLT